MARLDEIFKELDAGYNPQRQALQQRLDALPAQADAEIAGLNATKDQAFQDILGGARDRGMGFSGVPIAEQSRYTASQFLPAVARVRQSQNDVRGSLFDALNNVNLDQRKYATSLYQTELDRAEQARQSAAQSNPFAGLFNPPPPTPTPIPVADPYASINKSNANNAIHALLNTKNIGLIQSTINAITKSANAGNAYDKYKLELLQAVMQGNNDAAYNPEYVKLLKAASTYKAPAKKQSAPRIDTRIYPNANRIPGLLGINR